MKRSEMLAAIEDSGTTWDVIVVGGGATGLGAALEAASRGHRTVLVESHDFAQGTSSRSTKLIHGGVRYLRQGRIGLVRQSLKERQRLLNNAPHLVHTLDFVMPTYRCGARSFYYCGMRVYDLLAGQVLSGRARSLSRNETSRSLPNLRSDGLLGGVMYGDGQFDDSRLAISLARTAVNQGAVVANYLQVESLIRTGSRTTGVIVRDLLSGREHSLSGRVVLNATGIFAAQLMEHDAGYHVAAQQERKESLKVRDDAPPAIAPSQGSHLVVDAEFLPGMNALMIPETDDGRVLFAIPWHGKVLLGTTDVAVSQISRDPRPLASETDYLLDHADRYLQHSPQISDVRSMFAGLRPLVASKTLATATASLSREHLIHISGSGLISVIGGKWTTYRQMGEDLINHAELTGNLRRRQSVTSTLRLHGFPQSDHRSDFEAALKVYGSDSAGVMQLTVEDPGLATRLHSRLPYLAAEVIWAARHEMAQTIEDVLSRRTRALFLDVEAAIGSAPLVAELMAKENQQSIAWQREQVQAFCSLAQNTYRLKSA